MNIIYRIAKLVGIETKYDLMQRITALEEELKIISEKYSRKLEESQQYKGGLEQTQETLAKSKSHVRALEEKLKEFGELSESILRDKDIAKTEIKRLRNILGTRRRYNEMLSNLTEFEMGVLYRFIPKKVSTRNPEDKLHYRRIHSDPNGFEQFLSRLKDCKYVDDIYGMDQTHRNAKGINFDRFRKEHNRFIIEGLYSHNNLGKLFVVHTTAENEQEVRYIIHLLNSQFSK